MSDKKFIKKVLERLREKRAEEITTIEPSPSFSDEIQSKLNRRNTEDLYIYG